MRSLALLLMAVAAGAADPVSYTKQIQPILLDSCYSCHGPDKQKGGLRLDSPEAIQKGSKNGLVITAGNSEKSPLWKLTTLPKGDDDAMPGKGDSLSTAKQDLLKRWIEEGAKFDGAGGGPVLASADAGKNAPSLADLGQSNLDVLTAALPTPDAAAIKELIAAGGLVTAVSQKGNALDVDLSHTRESLSDKHLALLSRIATNVVWLDLRATPLTDAQLATVAKCKSLIRLHLDRTPITGSGLPQLKSCPQLEYLNLVSTKVTDASLASLASLTSLKAVYLWQSQATAAGAQTLEKALPTCHVNTGPEFSAIADSVGDGKKKRKK